jgi:hypothetical protein
MQIDDSDDSSNADFSIQQRREADSKVTVEMTSQPQKHPISSRAIVFGIVRSPPAPKYSLIEVTSKSARKSPKILMWLDVYSLACPTEISRRYLISRLSLSRFRRPGGRQIVESDEQPEKACSPIDESAAPDSNATVERESHIKKQAVQSFSTEDGMRIDASDEHANAESSIDKTWELDSNVTIQRERHPWKHPLQSVSTNDGMQIDDSDAPENADFPIDES